MAAEGRAMLGAGRGPCGGAPWKPGFRARPGERHGPRPAACVVAPVVLTLFPLFMTLRTSQRFGKSLQTVPLPLPVLVLTSLVCHQRLGPPRGAGTAVSRASRPGWFL